MEGHGKEIKIYDTENLPFGRPVNLERNASFEKGIVIKDAIALPYVYEAMETEDW